MSVAVIVKERAWFSLADLLPMEAKIGASLTEETVIETVAVLESACPSLARKVKESVPL